MFKPGSGQFDFIFDLEEKADQTLHSRFNFLENLPLRKFKTCKNSIGCEIEKGNEDLLVIELKDVND